MNYLYDANLGHLKALKDLSTGAEHWALLSTDADGKTKSERLGGLVTTNRAYNAMRRPYTTVSSRPTGGTLQSMEYAFDSLGNLTSRKDYVQSSQESFLYDALNRLKTTTTQYTVGTQSLSLSKRNDYDGHGNLINKEGITATYGSDGIAPSRIHQINEAKNTGVTRFFLYDKNGNATHIGDSRNVIWNSFNKVEKITKGSEMSTFYYNADQQRVLQQAIWYARDGAMERSWDRSDGCETYKYQLRVGDQSIGYLRHTYYPSSGSSTEQRLYTLTDHLGSIQTLVKADGRKAESLSFSAWGERRAADWNPTGIATPALDLARNWGLTQGFTGHEADEPWGLINMKGRLYDPIVGRFLSADPFIQFTTNT